MRKKSVELTSKFLKPKFVGVHQELGIICCAKRLGEKENSSLLFTLPCSKCVDTFSGHFAQS